MTVGELTHLLQAHPATTTVEVWIPGQHFAIVRVIPLKLIYEPDVDLVMLECRPAPAMLEPN